MLQTATIGMENHSIKGRLRSQSKTDHKDTRDYNMAGSSSTPGSSTKKDKSEEITTEKIWSVLQDLVTTVNGLQNQLSIAQGTVQTQSISTRLDATDQSLSQVITKLNLVGNMIIRHEERLDSIENGIKMDKRHKARPNLVIHGIIESESETVNDCMTKAKKFFTDQLEFQDDDIKLKKAHRLGVESKYDRPMLVRLENPNDKATVFKSVSKLKGKENVKCKLYFVDDDNDPEQAEVKQYLRDLKKKNQLETEEQNKLTLRIHKGKIVANNDIVKQCLVPPTDARLLSMSESEMAEIKAVKLFKGEEFTEKNSEYTSYV